MAWLHMTTIVVESIVEIVTMLKAFTPAQKAHTSFFGNLLESKRAPKEILCCSKVGLFGRRAAEQEELVWRVHELELLWRHV